MKTKNELIQDLNISNATLNNWYKTGFIKEPNNLLAYTDKEYLQIKDIVKNQSNKLKLRANRLYQDKTSICYLGITDKARKLLLEQAVQIHNNSHFTVEKSVFLLSVYILITTQMIKYDFIERPNSRLDLFLLQWAHELKIKNIKNNLYATLPYVHCDDDFIGAFYQSVTNVALKSKYGAYFTPSNLLDDIVIPKDSKVLDPCCGSGGILIRVLSKKHNIENVYGYDIDSIALKICTVNLSLFFKSKDIKFTVKNKNVLYPDKSKKNILFDNIITNPPWGSKIDHAEKLKLIKKYPEIQTSESFSIAIYNCINMLSKRGSLIFFLPYSMLNVNTHKNIRKYILSKKNKIIINLLGNAFNGVVSETIRLKYFNDKKSNSIEIFKNGVCNKILYDTIENDSYIIQANVDRLEHEILNKIFNQKHTTLKNKAIFALGIVTGNNKKNIHNVKKKISMEPIYRGRDIVPFKLLTPKCYIEFKPQIFQQVAPEYLYRKPKIVYRFISNKIICALDTKGSLLLNSANLFIPTINYPLKSIVCLFNSKLYTFIYNKMFYSKKVLRRHIETFPLPIVDGKTHLSLERLYHDCMVNEKNIKELNTFVYKLFNLTQNQIYLIENEYK